MNLYYALATITDTDDSEIVLEWYYYEHDFGGVELVTDSFEHDLALNMTGTEWGSWLKNYYPNAKVVKL